MVNGFFFLFQEVDSDPGLEVADPVETVWVEAGSAAAGGADLAVATDSAVEIESAAEIELVAEVG